MNAASSKTWGDKADKDLFFTILSVKNIGVISGAEWTTIGNHMRTLGYGFTNEGCRQHFQGLRRAQQKAESNGNSGDNPRKLDPTLNPITRRPGPGRGRPRKSGAGLDPSLGGSDQDAQHELDAPGSVSSPITPGAVAATQPSGADDLALAPNGDDSEHIAKRPRLEENQDPALDDEAVLSALAAHSNPTPVDHYSTEFYGEA